MRQIRDRLLSKMGDSAEIQDNTIIIYGITEEEWNRPDNQSLLFDEPDVEPTVGENEEAYTVYIPINHD